MRNRKPSGAGICFRWRSLAWGLLGLQDAPTPCCCSLHSVYTPGLESSRQSLLHPTHREQAARATSILGRAYGDQEHFPGKPQPFRASQGHASPNWFSDFTPHVRQYGL